MAIQCQKISKPFSLNRNKAWLCISQVNLWKLKSKCWFAEFLYISQLCYISYISCDCFITIVVLSLWTMKSACWHTSQVVEGREGHCFLKIGKKVGNCAILAHHCLKVFFYISIKLSSLGKTIIQHIVSLCHHHGTFC